MTRALARTHFHSSPLLRFLLDLSLAQALPQHAFAEKLGQWLDFKHAIALCAAHGAGTANTPAAPAAVSTPARQEFARVQAALAHSIRQSHAVPILELPLELASAYAPYRRYYAAQQREMEQNIRPLRAQLRHALTRASPALGKLALLDGALDGILLEREASLLAKLPRLFEQHFGQLFQAHQQTLARTQQADDPARWVQPGAWLARFDQDLQTLLLAELDLRLQPTLGLLEALNPEITPSS